MWSQQPSSCPYCLEPYKPATDHILRCARAPWNRQPGWQVAAPTSSRWIQFRLWLNNKFRRR